MTASANRAYLPEVDQIRALAALLVLFYHGLQVIGAQLSHGRAFNPDTDWLRPANPLISILEEGHSGVALALAILTYRTVEAPFLALRPKYIDRGF